MSKSTADFHRGLDFVNDGLRAMVTNRGQLIRCPVHDIRIARRQTQGVTVFRVGDDEEVVAVAHLSDLGEDDGGSEEAAPEGDAPTDGGGK